MMEHDDLFRRLWLVAQLQAAEFGLGFGDDCADHVQDFINMGISNMLADQDGHIEDAIRIAYAENALRTFVLEMIMEARRLGLDELREVTFHHAFGFLCPIWPFCPPKNRAGSTETSPLSGADPYSPWPTSPGSLRGAETDEGITI